MDVLEMDAASESGVGDVRNAIVEAVEYRPATCRFKVFIIDEVHDLSTKAFDALLKTIEEPPGHVIFILATTEFNRVPPTIRSRCQKYEFHRAAVQDLMRCLESVARAEGAEAAPSALAVIARMADGGYRDALTLLEQVLIAADGEVTPEAVYDQLGLIADETADEMLLAMRDGEISKLIELLAKAMAIGRDPRSVVESLLYRIADLTRAAYGLDSSEDSTHAAALHSTANRIGRQRLLELRSGLAEIHQHVRDVTMPRIWLESRLMRLALPQLPATVAPQPPVAAARPVGATPRPVGGTPRPVAVPGPEAARAATQPAPTPKEVTPTTQVGDELWRQLVASFAKEGKMPPIGLRLQRAHSVARNGTVFTVEMSQFDADWIQQDPKRSRFVVDALKALTRQEFHVEYLVASGQKSENPATEAVELPLEGRRLEEKTREILGLQNESKESQ
jgi:DNA polymerase-3 subunit gamma/tau